MTKGTNSLYSLRGTSPSSKHLPCSQKLSLLSARSLLIQGGANNDNFWGYCTPRPPIGRSSKSTPQHNKQSKPNAKFAVGVLLGWPLPWPQKNVLIHLIQNTFSGVAPEPPIGRSSKSTPIHNKKASPKPNWLWACFLASPCHGHPQLSLFT